MGTLHGHYRFEDALKSGLKHTKDTKMLKDELMRSTTLTVYRFL